jgi:hypothetical protein
MYPCVTRFFSYARNVRGRCEWYLGDLSLDVFEAIDRSGIVSSLLCK